jgi:hypothetical protein
LRTQKPFENGDTDPRLSTLHKWRRALEAAGVMFIDPDDQHGRGVRLRGAKGSVESVGAVTERGEEAGAT